MQKSSFGKRMQFLRETRHLTQKEFSEFLEIPQPTLSQYENDRISPNMDVLIVLAQKCQVSIDFLCGMTPLISSVGDIVEFFYNLMDVAEISGQIVVNQNSAGINFTYFDNQWHQTNKDICFILGCIKRDLEELKAGHLSKSMLDMMRRRTIENFTEIHLTQKSLLTNENVKTDISIFNADERSWINSASRGMPLKEFTREQFLSNIELTISITTDDLVVELAEGLKNTVTSLTDEKWNSLITKIPYPVPYDDESAVHYLDDESNG